MKKTILFFAVALMAVTFLFSSCNKNDDVPNKTYAEFVSGDFIANTGDIVLKSAPTVGGHWFDVLDKKVNDTEFTRVDGTEFITGSDAYNDWLNFTPKWFGINSSVYVTYCPVLPLRAVLQTTVAGSGSDIAYFGFWEGTPNVESFPITVYCKRLGDSLMLDATNLTSLPGYTNMSFDVTYTKSTIDIDATAKLAPAYDGLNGEWPQYKYSSASTPTVHITDAVTTIYGGYDAKVTGNINIKVNVDGTIIDLGSIPASGLGYGMKIVLNTTKTGWYNSGTIDIDEEDIGITVVNITVN